jgi:hypothetical protein
MPTPRAVEIYEAAERAIYELVVQGTQSATFEGRSYTALDLDRLRSVRDEYRAIALARGEISESNPAAKKVSTSYARIIG